MGKRRASGWISLAAEARVTRSSPYVIELSDADRAVLEARTRAYTLPHREVLRAKIVLMAADRVENVLIAQRLDVSVTTVSLWRKRFFEHGVAGLAERKRSGRPQTFSPSGARRGGGVGVRTASAGAPGGAGTVGAAGG